MMRQQRRAVKHGDQEMGRFAVLKKNFGPGTPPSGNKVTRFWVKKVSTMVAVSLTGIDGNRVGSLGHPRGSPSMLKSLLARAQVHLHLHQPDA